jgi:thiamine pyrophosphate-dependent acetolactate synthase large subunit-like protein
VLVVPADISNAAAEEERPYTVHARQPVIRPSDADLDEIAAILNDSDPITIYAGAGRAGAHDEVVATAERLSYEVGSLSGPCAEANALLVATTDSELTSRLL